MDQGTGMAAMPLSLFKQGKPLAGLSTALYKTALEYRRKGHLKNGKRCEAFILSRFTHSNEATLITDTRKRANA